MPTARGRFLFSKFQLGEWREALRSFDTNGLAHWFYSNGISVFEIFVMWNPHTNDFSLPSLKDTP